MRISQLLVATSFFLQLPGIVHAATAGPMAAPHLSGRLEGSSGESVEFTRDGGAVLTAGNGSARLWDARLLKPMTPSLTHGLQLRLGILSPNEKLAATVGGVEVRIWNLPEGKLVRELHHGEPVLTACFTPDSRYIVTGGRDARVWDVESGKEIVTFKHDAQVAFVVLSPDGKKMLTLSNMRTNGAASIWSMSTGARLVTLADEAHYGPADSRRIALAAWDPTGMRVATISFKAVSIWDAVTGDRIVVTQIWHDEEQGEPSSLAFSREGRLLLIAKEGALVVLNAATGQVVREIKEGIPAQTVECAWFARNQPWIVASSKYDGAGIWDLNSGKKLLAFEPPDPPREFRNFNSIPALAFDELGSRVATGWRDGNYTAVWDVGGR
jgi:WD40 repeat protein